jgi:hypothetical protein
MVDLVVIQQRLKDIKFYIEKAIKEKRLDKSLDISLIQKEAELLGDIVKKIEEVEERLDLLEGKFGGK